MTGDLYYQARLTKGGPFVAVRVFFAGPMIDGEIQDRSPRWQALVSTERDARMILMGDAMPIEVDGITLRGCERITDAEYRYLLAHGEWCDATTANHPRTTPRQAVDFNTLAPRF